MTTPVRGDIWWVNSDPIEGHGQAGRRPALVLSADTFNRGPQRLVVVAPMSRTLRSLPLHVRCDPKDCGPRTTLRDPGMIRCDQIRTVALDRFLDAASAGHVTPSIMSKVEVAVRALLMLPENP